MRAAIREDRESLSMSLILRKVMTRGVLEVETQREILKEKRKWSLMWNGTAEQLKGVRAEQQTRSREWPLMCAGKSVNCWKP